MKQRYYKSLVAGAILAGLSQQAVMAAELEPIHSAQDTWVTVPANTKATIFGGKNIMKVDRKFSGFVQFVIPAEAIPVGEVIDKVILKLKSVDSMPDAYIAKVTEPGLEWDETVVTESVYPFVIGDKIPGAVKGLASDVANPEDTWAIQADTVYEFDITSAVAGAGTYTFNVDMEDTTLGNKRWKAGVFGSTDTNRPTLQITTKMPAPTGETTDIILNSDSETGVNYLSATSGLLKLTTEQTGLQGINWSLTDDEGEEIQTGSDDSLIVDPADLLGAYTVAVTATDSEDAAFSLNIDLMLVPALPILAEDEDTDGDGILDSDEGYKDSDADGILDFNDTNADTTTLPVGADNELQTETGLSLSLGTVSTSEYGVMATTAAISREIFANNVAEENIADDNFVSLTGTDMLNFKVSGLTGTTASIVYPLPGDATITASTVYRKYTPTEGWVTFSMVDGNDISSASKVDDACPEPLSASYLAGLTAGDNCIQLTIVDNGIYDIDETLGQIEDPGVLAESNFAPSLTAGVELQVNAGAANTIDLTQYASDDNDAASALVFEKIDGPAWLSINAAGSLSGTPSNDDTTLDSVNVKVSDTSGLFDEAAMSITVNKAPVVASETITTATAYRNEAYSANIAEYITEAEGDSYTVNKVSGPHWLTVSESGELSGTPRKADMGDNIIGIEVVDADGAKASGTFTVTVEDNGKRASDAGSFSAALFAMLGLVSLRRRKQK